MQERILVSKDLCSKLDVNYRPNCITSKEVLNVDVYSVSFHMGCPNNCNLRAFLGFSDLAQCSLPKRKARVSV